ncbi:MAG: hypothetical protein AAF585_15255 [Verrucomicrobiota bacterium]
MSQQLFVDYHFHPNFNFRAKQKRIIQRCERIWNAFELAELDVVICSEHAWKRPADSWHLLMKHKPKYARTILLPGVEVLTSEGIDIVVFGHCPSWYADTHLNECLEPFSTPLEQVINRVTAANDATGFIPHPYTAGKTGVIKHYGREGSRDLAARLGAIETSNNAFADTLTFTDNLIGEVFKKTQRKMVLTQQIDDEFSDDLDLDFVAVGSDAHCPKEIGYGVHLEHQRRDMKPSEAFQLMMTNKNAIGVDKLEVSKAKRFRRVWRSAAVTFREYMEKQQIKGRMRRAAKRCQPELVEVENVESLV